MSGTERTTIARLIDRAQQGDDSARQRLFALGRNYMALVARAHVESWLRVKVDASDLVQQTMLEAHRGFERSRPAVQMTWPAPWPICTPKESCTGTSSPRTSCWIAKAAPM